MAKQRNTNQRPGVVDAAPKRLVRFVGSDTYFETLNKYGRDAQVLQALRNFIAFKRENPLQQAGGKDRPYIGSGPLSGYIHAGLTRDISVVYTISGRDPHIIKLFGLYTHQDTGTGTPGRPQLSKVMANSWNKQSSFRPIDKLDESTDLSPALPLLQELLEMVEA